jgi:hypothetical protein
LSKIVISQAEVTIVAEITLSELKLSPENDNIFSFIIIIYKFQSPLSLRERGLGG